MFCSEVPNIPEKSRQGKKQIGRQFEALCFESKQKNTIDYVILKVQNTPKLNFLSFSF